MTHLGTQISALADGRLTGAARERALCHVAACTPCADELAATRAARRALAAATDVPPAPDLAPRLLALGAGGPCGTRDTVGRTGSTRPRDAAERAGRPSLGGGPVLGDASALGAAGAVLAASGLRGTPLGGVRLGDPRFGASVLGAAPVGGRRAPVRTVAVLTAGAVVVGLFVLGDARDVTPDSHPAADLALLAAAGSPDGGALPVVSSGVGGADVGADTADDAVIDAAIDAVWPGGVLPEGYVVVATHGDASRVELDLDGPAGPVVVLRQTGRLRDDVVADVPAVAIGDHDVHILSIAPWHAVWQSGDAVVGVVAAHRSAAVEELVAAYPAEHVDDGLGARMSRGWQTVVGAWAP